MDAGSAPRVSIARCGSYDRDQVRAAVASCLAPLGGISVFVQPGTRVLVKPNLLSSRQPEDAVTTHPALVRAVVEQVQAAGATAVVGDSPGGRNTRSSYAALLKRTGMQEVIDGTGCEVAYFDDAYDEVPAPAGATFRRFRIARAVREADTVICISRMKTHQLALLPGAVKVLYGYIPGVAKAEYHLHTRTDADTFADLLLDLCTSFPPALSVMDAVVGMEGHGPSHGRPREVGLVLASPSPFALDMAAARIMGFAPEEVPTIRRAVARGIGPAGLAAISFPGEPADAVRVPPFRHPGPIVMGRVPAPLVHLAGRLLASRPEIRSAVCRRCGKCAESCPPGAITFVKGRVPRIHHHRCIRCFCCLELCPEEAVEVTYPWIRRVLFP
ncbi:MAG: DUF362 domain-containing protein [Methanomicrobiales archaeon]|nr:DUF362 domain-containing protein [Methanomicrobiales archaeon]